MPNKPNTTVIWDGDTLPDCDLCKIAPIGDRATARRYDARLKDGRWGYVCQGHFEDNECTLGLGCGQELLTQGRVAAERALDQASIMFLADPTNQFKQDVWLKAHRDLVDILYPEVPNVALLAENHPMRNHPAYRAMQARLKGENEGPRS